MNNDDPLDTAASVFQRSGTKPRGLSKGHGTAHAAGAPTSYRESNEDTPLLWRTDSIASQTVAGQGTTATDAGGSSGDDGAGDPSSPTTEWPGIAEFAHLPWYRRPSIFWLLPSLLVHTLAFSALLVPKLTLILELVCRDYFADRALHDPSFVYTPVVFDGSRPNDQCDEAVIQKLVSEFTLAIQLITGILTVLVAPRLGALSDRYGRTRVVAITGLGVFFNEFITICAAKYPETISVNWLLLGAFFDGLSGTFVAALAVTNAYTSDCMPPAGRVVAFGWVQGALFSGVAIGPFLASIVIETTGSVLNVFYLAIAIHAVIIPYNLFVVPESLTKQRQLEARAKAKIAWETPSLHVDPPIFPEFKAMHLLWNVLLSPKEVIAPLTVLYPKGPGATPALRRNLMVLASIDMILFGTAMGAGAVIVYYSRFMFHWTPVQSSNFIATVSLFRVLTLLFIVPILTRLVRGKTDTKRPTPNTGSDNLDIWFIRIGIFLDTLGLIGYSTSKQGTLFFLSGCVASFGSMASPTLQSSLTKHAPSEVAGKLLGANSMLQGLARIVAPLVLNLIYAETVQVYPRAVFMVLVVVFFLTFILSLLLRPHVYLQVDEREASVPPEQETENDSLL